MPPVSMQHQRIFPMSGKGLSLMVVLPIIRARVSFYQSIMGAGRLHWAVLEAIFLQPTRKAFCNGHATCRTPASTRRYVWLGHCTLFLDTVHPRITCVALNA